MNAFPKNVVSAERGLMTLVRTVTFEGPGSSSAITVLGTLPHSWLAPAVFTLCESFILLGKSGYHLAVPNQPTEEEQMLYRMEEAIRACSTTGEAVPCFTALASVFEHVVYEGGDDAYWRELVTDQEALNKLCEQTFAVSLVSLRERFGRIVSSLRTLEWRPVFGKARRDIRNLFFAKALDAMAEGWPFVGDPQLIAEVLTDDLENDRSVVKAASGCLDAMGPTAAKIFSRLREMVGGVLPPESKEEEPTVLFRRRYVAELLEIHSQAAMA